MSDLVEIAIVFDCQFGDRLFEFARNRHVWVVGSPKNDVALNRLWHGIAPQASRDVFCPGATRFAMDASERPEQVCISMAETIDDHYGERWSEIEVYGAELTPAIKSAYMTIGTSQFEMTPHGFVCRRSTPLRETRK